MVEHVQRELSVSERRACKVLNQPRSTQRYSRRQADDEPYVVSRIVALACQFGRYGYRRILELLRREKICINHKRLERIWRQEGLKVPSKQPKRRRLWLNDGSCVRRRPGHKDDVWSYDFVVDRTHDGKRFRMLTILDEYTRECLAIDVGWQLKSDHVLENLTRLFIERGTHGFQAAGSFPSHALLCTRGRVVIFEKRKEKRKRRKEEEEVRRREKGRRNMRRT